MARSTGNSAADAQDDFLRARRARVLSELSRRLRRAPGDVHVILPFEEVVAALGRVSEHYLGLKTVSIDSIVGSVDRTRDFDRDFRPRTNRVRGRWERIAEAQRRGQAMPPISLYRIGDVHFVRDGHHRVSVARALGHDTIDAYVADVRTRVGADGAIRLSDLPTKSQERLFRERVPLPPDDRVRIQLRRSDDWGELAEGIEAWGFRRIQGSAEPLERHEVAREWFDSEYAPVVEMLREADLVGDRTETEAYMRVAAVRYRLLGTHAWSEEIIEQLRGELERRR
jgi:hypothetical protein